MTGDSSRRRWSRQETDKLVSLVSVCYKFLTEGFTPSKTKAMVDRKWEEITEAINSLGDGAPLTVSQIHKKWTDIKSTSKGAVSKYKKAQAKTGLGADAMPKEPSELQYKVASLIGKTATEGIEGAENFDTSIVQAPPSSSSAVAVITRGDTPTSTSIIAQAAEETGVSISAQSTPAKRPRPNPKQTQLQQNKELIQTEVDIRDEIRGLREEFKTTNMILNGILYEMKRSNDMKMGNHGATLNEVLQYNT